MARFWVLPAPLLLGSRGGAKPPVPPGAVPTPFRIRLQPARHLQATETPDGKSLTAAGLIAAYVHCHERAPYDNLFGLTQEENR